MITNKNMQSGRSMIEMLGVLAIIGVLSVGGIAGYSKAMMKYKVNKTVDQITQIATNIRTLFGGQRNYDALNYNVMEKAHLVPDEMASGTGNSYKVYSPWQEEMVIEKSKKSNSDAGSNQAFYIKIPSVPTEACIELAVMDWGSSSGSGLVAFSVGQDLSAITEQTCTQTTSATAGQATVCAKQGNGVMTPDIAVSACAKATDDGGNDLYWKFY